MKIFEKGSGLHLVSSSLRFANDNIREAGREIGKSLTATMDQEDPEQMLLSEMTPEERHHYMQLPDRKKRQLLQKIIEAKEPGGRENARPERATAARKNPVIAYQKKVQGSGTVSQQSSIRSNERPRYRQEAGNVGEHINLKHTNRNPGQTNDAISPANASVGLESPGVSPTGRTVRPGKEPTGNPTAGVVGAKYSRGTSAVAESAGSVIHDQSGRMAAAFSAGAKTAAKEGTRKGTSAASGAATGGASTIVIETVDAAKKKAKQAAEKIRAAMEESRWEKEQMVSSLTKADKKEKKKLEEEGSYSPSWLAALLFGTFFLLIVCLLLLFQTVDTSNPDYTYDEQGAQLLVAVAQTELEQSDNNIGGAKYKNWYGMNANWCAMFVSWCSDQCGYVESEVMPKTASVATMKQWYIERNLFQPATSTYDPKPGDIIILGNGMSHTGIVTGYDAENGIVTTIEGNTGVSNTDPYHAGSRVAQDTYAKTNTHIIGYCTPEYPPPEEETETEQPSEE